LRSIGLETIKSYYSKIDPTRLKQPPNQITNNNNNNNNNSVATQLSTSRVSSVPTPKSQLPHTTTKLPQNGTAQRPFASLKTLDSPGFFNY